MKVNDTLSKMLSDNSFEDKIKSYDKNIEFCKAKIAEIPEEEMPEEVKEIVKEATQ